MMFLIIMVVTIFVLHSLMPPPVHKKSDKCPPHTWIYDSTGFLLCSICNGKPGYQGRE